MKNNINVLFNLSAQELKNFMTHLSVRTHEPYLYFFDVIKNCDNLSCRYACECDTVSHKLADPKDGYLYFLKYNRTKKVKRINNAAAAYIALARIWNKFIQSDKPEELDCILYTSNTKFIDIFNDIIAGFMIQARMNGVYSGNYRGVQVLGIMESLKDQDLDKFYDETFTWVREKWGVNKRSLKWKRMWNVKFQSIKDFVKIIFDQKNLKVYIELNHTHSDNCKCQRIYDEISQKLCENHIYYEWCFDTGSKCLGWRIPLGFNADESIKDRDRYLISVPDYIKSKDIDLENIEVESIEFDISILK